MRRVRGVWLAILVLCMAAVQVPHPWYEGASNLTCAVALSGASILSEGFEGSFPPDGWTVTVIDPLENTTNGNWTRVSAGTYPDASPPEGKFMALFNSFSCPSDRTARLATPLLPGAEHVALIVEFWMFHSPDAEGSSDTLVVQLSPDGLLWTEIARISRYRTDREWSRHDVYIPLDGIDDQFQIGFLGVSDFGADMYLDGIAITAPYETDAGIVSIPQPSTEFVTEAATVTVAATVYNFGSITLSDIPVSMSVSGPASYWYETTEILEGPLLAQHEDEMVFTSAWNAPTVPGTYTLKVFTSLVGDGDHDNDVTTRTITVYGEDRLYEGFDTWPPEGWTVVDTVSSHWEQDDLFHVPHSSNWSAYASRDSNGSADCWLITPRCDLQDSDILSFWYATGTWGSGEATLEVALSTGDSQTAVGDFTTLLWEDTTSSHDWTEQKIALAPYTGQLVYIGFHVTYLEDYMDSLVLDDVYGPTLWQPTHDVAPISINQPISGDTIGEQTFGASVKNYGQNSESFWATCSVYRLQETTGAPFATPVYQHDAFVSNLGSGAIADVTFSPTLTILYYGYYAINITTTLGSDEHHGNDHLNQTVYIGLPAMNGLEVDKTILDTLLKQWVKTAELAQGSTATVRIAVTNTLVHPLIEVNVTDHLPDGLEYASPSEATSDDNGPVVWDQHISWTVSSLAPGETESFVFDVAVVHCGTLVNRVNVTGIVEEKTRAIGISSDSDTATVMAADRTPPTTTLTVQGPAATLNQISWIGPSTYLELNAEDNCGKTTTFYRIQYENQWSAWEEYTERFVLSDECTHIIEFYSIDEFDNTEDPIQVPLQVDGTPPISTFAAGTPHHEVTINNSTTIFITNQTSLRITAADTGKCAIGSYQLWYGLWGQMLWTGWMAGKQNRALAFTLPDLDIVDEGMYLLSYYGQDPVSNIEQPRTVTVAMDVTPPHTTLSINGSQFTDQQQQLWIGPATSLELTAIDAGTPPAGVKGTWYAVDDEAPHTYNTSFILAEGSHLVQYFSEDYVNNTEMTNVTSISVDARPPNTAVIFNGSAYEENTHTWVTSETAILLEARDEESGINQTFYRVDEGPWIEYSGAFTIAWPGHHMLGLYSIDRVGNEEAVTSRTIIVYDTPPQISIDDPKEGWLYIFGRQTVPLLARQALVVGSLVVRVSVQSNLSVMKNVSFALDGTIKFIDQKAPYEWRYTERVLLGHEITVVASDHLGRITKKNISVFVLSI